MKLDIGHWALGIGVLLAACTDAAPEKVNLITGTKFNETVEAPANCPDWSKSQSVQFFNTSSSNFSCSTYTNFGAMIENHDDMISGRSSGTGNGARNAIAVTQYETNTVPPLSSGSGGSSSGGGSSQ